ncbi:hypothetical protein NP493_1583g00072 [Ridgeia piscesae]|uniref:Uncharacterized protein n=1 Tax=Ridgeia piscesae TaxID=27915 RepID=A0AAD9JYU4_RIDPI|nr:hypothetical protein NP493_1583g00072 [Ridgeia piscesae]
MHSVCLADVPKLPTTHNQLKSGGPADVGKQSGCQRTKFKLVLNSDHLRRDLRRLNVGETIRMQPLEQDRREWAEATVHTALSSRSYDVITSTGRHYRRNRRHIRPSRPSEHNTTHDRADRPERMIPPSGARIELTIRKPSQLRQTQPQLNKRKLQQSHRIHDQVR